jgi:hypothetical protein
MRRVQSRVSEAEACDQEKVFIAVPKSIGASVDRPSGTLVVIPRYPALKRGANLGRPSGAGLGRLLSTAVGSRLFSTRSTSSQIAHTQRSPATSTVGLFGESQSFVMRYERP